VRCTRPSSGSRTAPGRSHDWWAPRPPSLRPAARLASGTRHRAGRSALAARLSREALSPLVRRGERRHRALPARAPGGVARALMPRAEAPTAAQGRVPRALWRGTLCGTDLERQRVCPGQRPHLGLYRSVLCGSRRLSWSEGWWRVGLYAGFCRRRRRSEERFAPEAAIPLGRRLPAGSSGLPGGVCGRAVLPLSGLAPGGVCRAARITPGAGALLPHRFTLACAGPPAIGGLLSVALSCGSPRLGVTQHPALWSPDVPRTGPPLSRWPARDRPAGSPPPTLSRQTGPVAQASAPPACARRAPSIPPTIPSAAANAAVPSS
jgi:hypothetical protein